MLVLFLIEGADGTGKTTLAESLCAEYDAHYLHFGIPDEHPIAYWMKNGLSDYPDYGKDVVIDRLHLSEEAYGTVYRGGSGLSAHEFWLLEGWLWARNTILVMCEAGWGDMWANQHKAESQIYHDIQQVKIVDQFALLAKSTSLPVIFYNYRIDNLKLRRVARVGSKFYTRSEHVEEFGSLNHRINYDDDGIGALNPRVWLVGDQPNPNKEAPITALFSPAFQSSSGEYLRKALDGVLGWNEFHLSNSRDEWGTDWPLQSKWSELGNPPIVALGANAHKALDSAELDHQVVPHPQWWRRFRHPDMEEYGRIIVNQISGE